jgi:hypothetical protein
MVKLVKERRCFDYQQGAPPSFEKESGVVEWKLADEGLFKAQLVFHVQGKGAFIAMGVPAWHIRFAFQGRQVGDTRGSRTVGGLQIAPDDAPCRTYGDVGTQVLLLLNGFSTLLVLTRDVTPAVAATHADGNRIGLQQS